MENRWATRATNKVPAKTGTFLFTFGVWSCRRQRGDSPKPDERAPQRSEATATKYNPKVVWFKSCPTRFVENRWATHATNKVPVYAGTFLFTFGVGSYRRQRGESPKPDEKVVNKLFFCAQTFLFCPAGAESSSSCCFAGLPLCKHAKA